MAWPEGHVGPFPNSLDNRFNCELPWRFLLLSDLQAEILLEA